MLTFFVVLFALLLALIGFSLLKKPQWFLPLIGESTENRSFLNSFGILYLLAALVGIPVIVLKIKMLIYAYLLVVMVLTLFFSFRLSKKMTAPRE
ncbi:hypothetical protein P7G51_07640 [Enterococcus asini]|uniref:hypothetical protein n=1 Tax=Enterococcus TaxID=1350 RepID=UPI00288C98A7|nr:hypothetical protein [Enterococcus asini]MDT2757250.1 hypothetical protein [Enterococcus asini]